MDASRRAPSGAVAPEAVLPRVRVARGAVEAILAAPEADRAPGDEEEEEGHESHPERCRNVTLALGSRRIKTY